MNLRTRAKKLKTDLPAVFLALKKKETPTIAKLFALITIVYALSPIDLIPDFIPVLGYLDDIILLPLLISLTIHFIPNEIFTSCRVESENLWAEGKPKRWYYAIPIIVIWLFIMVLILNVFII